MERTKSLIEVSLKEFISSAAREFVSRNYSFSIWRLPESDSVFLAASDNPSFLSEVTLEESVPGFLFAPFETSKEKIFIPLDEFAELRTGKVCSSTGLIIEGLLAKRQDSKSTSPAPYHSTGGHLRGNSEMSNYEELVKKAVDQIKLGTFEKVVPSRSKTISLEPGFDIIDTFLRLSDLYPKAMISIFSSPGIGTWVGATPELLVGIDQEQHFRTAAVAGTQRFEEGTDLHTISWTQKEIEEQVLVVRYIISCFKKIRLREYNEVGPKTIAAGNVLHLKTDFDVDMIATNFPQLGSIMLKLLHPTSAVCGMPLQASHDFLRKNEGYDREFYSGYLGPINVNRETNIYVNLRCMQLFANAAILYAGAGVTADSIPSKELNETEMKMNTLIKSIQK